MSSSSGKHQSSEGSASKVLLGDKLAFLGLIIAAVSIVVTAYFGYLAAKPNTPAPAPTLTAPPTAALAEVTIPSMTATIVEVIPTSFSTEFPETPVGIIVTNARAPELPTNTSTSTPPPAPSDAPASQIAFPFIDNFDDQKSSLWEDLSGTWLIEEGRYTGLAGTGVGWFWTKLNITDLSDFRLSVNVKIPSYGAANEGDLAIAVRESQTQNEYIGYVFGFPRSTASWSFIEEKDRSAITNTFENIPAEANFEIEVVGDRFVAKVNGFEKQSITLSGYDRTWIGLGLKCGYRCPSFDDFRIEPVP